MTKNLWNVRTLYKHFNAIIGEQQNKLDERYASQQEALQKAESLLKEYKAASNEWRGALDDNRTQLTTRSEFDSSNKLLNSKIETGLQLLGDREVNIDKRVVLMEGRYGYISITMAVSVISMLLAIGIALMTLLQPHAAQLPIH